MKNSHCSYCGAAFAPEASWPRTCATCGEISFRNPIPVAIVLLPVVDEARRSGVVAVRRAIAPRFGHLALPGGYVDFGETWQEAGAREVYEEAGILIDAHTLRAVEVFSAPDGTLVIAGIAPPLAEDELPRFAPNSESSERVILLTPQPLAFPLHTELVTRFLNGESLGYSVAVSSA
jgi:ADP-ribose pyrophosphatase YjhB (NUDIX family)